MIEQFKVRVNESAQAIARGKSNADLASTLFTEVDSVFQALQDSFQRVHHMSGLTAQATDQQSTVTEELSRNLHELNQETISANDIAKSNETITHQTKELSANLIRLVGRFKIQ